MTTANTNARAIDALREEIDTLDQELLALMEKRLDLAAAIAAAKAPGDYAQTKRAAAGLAKRCGSATTTTSPTASSAVATQSLAPFSSCCSSQPQSARQHF